MSDSAPANSVKVDQASGMISVQADVSFVEAVTLMRVHADETNRSIDEIAALVLNRRISFGS